MDAKEIEHIVETVVRRVVREELAAQLGPGSLLVAREVEQPVAPVTPQGPDGHPFLLSERELRQAEKLLPAEEGAILRQRVYAARAYQYGNHKAAERIRRKADRMEEQMIARKEKL